MSLSILFALCNGRARARVCVCVPARITYLAIYIHMNCLLCIFFAHSLECTVKRMRFDYRVDFRYTICNRAKMVESVVSLPNKSKQNRRLHIYKENCTAKTKWNITFFPEYLSIFCFIGLACDFMRLPQPPHRLRPPECAQRAH